MIGGSMDGQGLRMCRFTRDGIPELGEYLESVDGIMRKEDGPIRHKEIFKESDGPVRKGKG